MTSPTSPAVQRLFSAMHDHLFAVPGAQDFARRLPPAPASCAEAPPCGPAPEPFVALTDWAGLASPAAAGLVGALMAASGALGWARPIDETYALGSGLAGAASTMVLVGPGLAVPSDRIAAGFFAVGAGVTYRDHRHLPAELYLPIAGRARYWCESAGWREAGPGTVMVHAPWEWHAMQTGDAPVLILWAWYDLAGFQVAPALRPTLAGQPAGLVAAPRSVLLPEPDPGVVAGGVSANSPRDIPVRG